MVFYHILFVTVKQSEYPWRKNKGSDHIFRKKVKLKKLAISIMIVKKQWLEEYRDNTSHLLNVSTSHVGQASHQSNKMGLNAFLS